MKHSFFDQVSALSELVELGSGDLSRADNLSSRPRPRCNSLRSFELSVWFFRQCQNRTDEKEGEEETSEHSADALIRGGVSFSEGKNVEFENESAV